MRKKWILPAVGALILCAGAVLFVKKYMYMEKPKADISIGRVLLSEMDEQSVDTVQGEIQNIQNAREEAARLQREAEEAALQAQHEAEEAARAAQEEAERAAYFQQWCDKADAMADADQFKAVFANSVVVGDSIVNGILQTDLMFPTSVVAKVGGNTRQLLDYIPQVQSLNPQHIFLYIGFNDIGMCLSDYDRYYSDITTFISQLQQACPGVPMYISHMVPPQSIEFLGHEEYWDVPIYNEILDRIASEYGLGIVETADLVKDEYYYKDGYHMIYGFYPKWLRRMAEVGGLM